MPKYFILCRPGFRPLDLHRYCKVPVMDASELSIYSQYGPSGASVRVRVLSWLDHLGYSRDEHYKHFDYLGQSNGNPSTILRNLQGVVSAEMGLRKRGAVNSDEVAFISRQASPFSNGRLEQTLLQAAHLGIYDFDDAIYAFRPWAAHKKLWDSRKTWSRSVEAADITIAGNDLLAEDAAQHSKSVVVIPSCIQTKDYIPKENYDTQHRQRVILWLGSRSTASNLALLTAPLEKINRSFPTVVLAVGVPPTMGRKLGPHILPTPWYPGIDRHLAQKADVAVMPLLDNFFNARKCGYKLLQYSAMAIPSVSSPVGAARKIADSLGALTARTALEWETTIFGLLGTSSTDDRQRIGQRQKRLVQRNFSYQAWASEFSRTTSLKHPL